MFAAIPRTVLGILVSLAALLTFEYYQRVERGHVEDRLLLHGTIIDGIAPSQYRHRVLVPYLVHALAKALSPLSGHRQRLRLHDHGSTGAFIIAYQVFDFAAILFSLGALYALLAVWFTSEQSLVGTLLAAFTMQLTFRDHYFHPWSLLEIGLFALGFLLIYREQHKWFGVVLVAASLNRETSIYLLIVFFFTKVIDWKGKPVIASRKHLALLGIYSAIWLAIFVGLRVALGFPPPTFTVEQAWLSNTNAHVLRWSAQLNALFFGVFWIYIALGFRRAPAFIRRASLMLPFYAVLIFVIGLWYEIRYLMTLYPVLIPLGLSYIWPRAEAAEGADD